MFPVLRISFSIFWRAGLVVLNSLSFCLSVKLLISPSYLNEIFAGYGNLDCRFISFNTWNMSCHFLLAWRVSIERSAIILMGIPCVLFVSFPLLLLIFALCVWSLFIWLLGFPDSSDSKVSAYNVGDLGSILLILIVIISYTHTNGMDQKTLCQTVL